MSFSNRVKSDRPNHFIVLHLLKLMSMDFCGDTTYIILLCDKKACTHLKI